MQGITSSQHVTYEQHQSCHNLSLKILCTTHTQMTHSHYIYKQSRKSWHPLSRCLHVCLNFLPFPLLWPLWYKALLDTSVNQTQCSTYQFDKQPRDGSANASHAAPKNGQCNIPSFQQKADCVLPTFQGFQLLHKSFQVKTKALFSMLK